MLADLWYNCGLSETTLVISSSQSDPKKRKFLFFPLLLSLYLLYCLWWTLLVWKLMLLLTSMAVVMLSAVIISSWAGLLSICSPGGPWRWRWWWSGHVFTDLLKMENMLSSECPLWDWAVAVWVPSPPTSSQHRVLLSSSGQLPGRNYMEDGCAPSILIISEMVFILQTHLCDDSSQFLHSQQ